MAYLFWGSPARGWCPLPHRRVNKGQQPRPPRPWRELRRGYAKDKLGVTAQCPRQLLPCFPLGIQAGLREPGKKRACLPVFAPALFRPLSEQVTRADVITHAGEKTLQTSLSALIAWLIRSASPASMGETTVSGHGGVMNIQ